MRERQNDGRTGKGMTEPMRQREAEREAERKAKREETERVERRSGGRCVTHKHTHTRQVRKQE